MPMPIAPMPKAIRITLAAIPPYANHFFISLLLSVGRYLGPALRRSAATPSAPPLISVAGDYGLVLRGAPALLLRRADDRDRPLRAAEQAERDAAEQRSRDRPVAARADDHQVDVVRVGVFDERVDGVAAQERRLRDDPVSGRECGRLVEELRVVRQGLVRERAAELEHGGRQDVERRDDVRENELCRVLSSQLDPEPGRLDRRRRAVG